MASYCLASFLFYTAFSNVHVCVLLGHALMPFPLFCQVGQNLTALSNTQLRFRVSCSCSFLEEGIQSKSNIWASGRLACMNGLYNNDDFCFMAEPVLLLRLLPCIPSWAPLAKGQPRFMGGDVKTCVGMESRAALWSQTWERIVFILMISAGRKPIWYECSYIQT